MNETGNGNKERNNAKIRKGENGLNVKSLVTSFIFTSEKRIKRIKYSCSVQTLNFLPQMSRDNVDSATDCFQDLKLQCVNLPFHFSPAFPHLLGSEWQTVPQCTVWEVFPKSKQPSQKALTTVPHTCMGHSVSLQLMCNFSVPLVSTYHSSKGHNSYSRALCANRCCYYLGDSVTVRGTLKGQARMLAFYSG